MACMTLVFREVFTTTGAAMRYDGNFASECFAASLRSVKIVSYIHPTYNIVLSKSTLYALLLRRAYPPSVLVEVTGLRARLAVAGQRWSLHNYGLGRTSRVDHIVRRRHGTKT